MLRSITKSPHLLQPVNAKHLFVGRGYLPEKEIDRHRKLLMSETWYHRVMLEDSATEAALKAKHLTEQSQMVQHTARQNRDFYMHLFNPYFLADIRFSVLLNVNDWPSMTLGDLCLQKMTTVYSLVTRNWPRYNHNMSFGKLCLIMR